MNLYMNRKDLAYLNEKEREGDYYEGILIGDYDREDCEYADWEAVEHWREIERLEWEAEHVANGERKWYVLEVQYLNHGTAESPDVRIEDVSSHIEWYPSGVVPTRPGGTGKMRLFYSKEEDFDRAYRAVRDTMIDDLFR